MRADAALLPRRLMAIRYFALRRLRVTLYAREMRVSGGMAVARVRHVN